jgi:hypothetical protein
MPYWFLKVSPIPLVGLMIPGQLATHRYGHNCPFLIKPDLEQIEVKDYERLRFTI